MGSDKYFELIRTIRLDLLELMGSGYVIDHCIAALSDFRQKRTLEIYISDALKNINEILAKHYGGAYLAGKYSALVHDKKEPEKTGDEIAADIIRRAGLTMKGG